MEHSSRDFAQTQLAIQARQHLGTMATRSSAVDPPPVALSGRRSHLHKYRYPSLQPAAERPEAGFSEQGKFDPDPPSAGICHLARVCDF